MQQIDYTIEEIKLLDNGYAYYITFMNYPLMDIDKQVVYNNIENYICASVESILTEYQKTPRGLKLYLKYPELEFLTSAIDKYISDLKHLELCYNMEDE